MHPLTPLILSAWRRLLPRLLNNPDELNKRLARRRATTFSRPPRPWSLAIRATDARIDALSDSPLPSSPRHPLPPSQLRPHYLTITADLLRRLNQPIHIDQPGLDAALVARRLGCPPSSLRLPRYRNLFHTHHVPLLSNKPGRPIPILHTPRPLHPNQPLRQPPDPLWGHIFPNTKSRPLLPHDFHQVIQRIPAFRHRTTDNPDARRSPSYHLPPPPPDYVWYKWKDGLYIGDPHDPPTLNRHATLGPCGLEHSRRTPNPRRHRKSRCATGSLLFHGWRFLCPACQKPTPTLYYPLFAVHSLNLLAMIPPSSLITPHSSLLPLNPEPRTLNPLPRNDPAHPDALSPPPQTLACHKCHRIRNVSLLERDGWNLLISHLSAGLLYGHEVPGNPWQTARDATRRRPASPPTRQDQAASNGTPATPQTQPPAPAPQPPAARPPSALPYPHWMPRRQRPYRPALHRRAPRRSAVLRRILNGWPIPRIAADLQISRRAVHHHIKALCHQENVPDRHALARKFNSPHALPPLPPSTHYQLPTTNSPLSYVQQRRDTIKSLLLHGLTRRQIMRHLNLPAHIVHYDTNRIYKQHNVHSAAELAKMLESAAPSIGA